MTPRTLASRLPTHPAAPAPLERKPTHAKLTEGPAGHNRHPLPAPGQGARGQTENNKLEGRGGAVLAPFKWAGGLGVTEGWALTVPSLRMRFGPRPGCGSPRGLWGAEAS